jgi:hypothetical protein
MEACELIDVRFFGLGRLAGKGAGGEVAMAVDWGGLFVGTLAELLGWRCRHWTVNECPVRCMADAGLI